MFLFNLDASENINDTNFKKLDKATWYTEEKNTKFYTFKISKDNILSKIKDREEAKKTGNYKLADQIRDDLNKEGIDIKDEKGKTTWNYK